MLIMLLAGALILLTGCTRVETNAEQVYAERCATCHGSVGQGGGRVARALPDVPTQFSSRVWRATVNENYVRKVIVRGGTEMGISPLMPSNEDLVSEPEVLNDLVQLVLSLSE